MKKTRTVLAALALFTFAPLAGCENDVEPDVRIDEELENDPAHDELSADDEAGGEPEAVREPEAVDEPEAEAEAPVTGDVQASTAAGATCDGNAHTGEYCGGDKVSNGSASTLYHCDGPGPASVVRNCANGCHVAPPGTDDYCNAPPAPTCDSDAHTGEYCGGDKVSNGNANKLYHCDGPGPATLVQTCSDGCTVAPAGSDDFCHVDEEECAHHGLLRWGLAPRQSDHLRCAGIDSSTDISQTIGSAAASAGTHAQDGTISGHAYCAATDLRTTGLSDTQVRALLNRLADQGVAAFYRKPGLDGWPSWEARHIHAIYVGVPMKASLRAQVQDWLIGRNGLASHSAYTFFQPTSAQKTHIENLFDAHN